MALGKIKADTLEHSTSGSVDTKFVVEGSAKQWVSFDPADFNVDDSLNCTSISDGPNAGEQTPNFVNTMGNSNYVVNALVLENQERILRVETRTTSSYTTQNTNDAGTAKDDLMGCLVHGDLA